MDRQIVIAPGIFEKAQRENKNIRLSLFKDFDYLRNLRIQGL